MWKISTKFIIDRLASVKITVGCLLFLFILTFWGTVAQVEQGLYYAQQRFFNSLFFLVGGWLPFPGTQLVLWILFVNLVCVTITRFRHYKPTTHLGILVTHSGILLYFIAAFVTFHGAKESQLTLMEKEGSNVSWGYHNWELSLWTQEGNKRDVIAFDIDNVRPGQVLSFDEIGLAALVKTFYPNSQPYTSKEGAQDNLKNGSSIHVIKPVPVMTEPENNFPGGIFKIKQGDTDLGDVLLYGGETGATQFDSGGKKYFLQLRRKRAVLPFVLKLKEFKMEVHPNTDIARSYESLVEIENNEVSREVLISMNNPLRYKDFTFYQASYAIDGLGREFSTLAVVKNSGRLLPYVASLLTFAGLAFHFLFRAFQGKSVKAH